MNSLTSLWKQDKLRTSLLCCWLLTVFASFFGSSLLRIPLPGLGHLFLFRMILPVTALLYVLYAVREKDVIWKDISAPEKWCWLLIALMLLYGTASLFWAINFSFTFQRLFNLYIDMCFFFLMLRLCRDKKVFRLTLAVCAVALVPLCIMGIYEIFFGGIFNPAYNTYHQFSIFMGLYQWPIVTYGNTNDYAASLIFTGTAFLLFTGYHWNKLRPRHLWLLVSCSGLLYFLVVACETRLVIGAFYLLLAGFTIFLFLRDRKRLWISAAVILCMCLVQFAHQYRYIVPPIQQYLAETKEYQNQQNEPSTEAPPQTKPPTLSVGNPNSESLIDTFYETDEETGEKTLGRANGSRVALIMHAFRCFRESHFLGVGLGNTEMLAKERQAAPNGRINIHCFVARIIGDFGIFVLIPLTAIGLLLIKRVWQALSAGRQRRSSSLFAFGVLYFFALLSYPILSSVSADAQDIIAMYIYLAAIVLFAEQIQHDTVEACTHCEFSPSKRKRG